MEVLGPISAVLGGPRPLLGPLGAVLGRSEAALGAYVGLGPMLAVLGGLGSLLGPRLAVWGSYGASVGGPGGSWVALGRLWGHSWATGVRRLILLRFRARECSNGNLGTDIYAGARRGAPRHCPDWPPTRSVLP